MDANEPHPPSFSERDAERLARERFGITARARALVSYADQNFRLEEPGGRELVLKVAHAGEDREVLDFQHRVLELLGRSLEPGAVPRVISARDGAEIVVVRGEDGEEHLARVLTFLPGVFLADVTPHTPELLRSLGTFLGTLDRVLAGFSHPAMGRHFAWDLKHAAETLHAHAADVAVSEDRALVEHFLGRFETRVLPLARQLRQSVVHNDANDLNVLVGHGPGGGQRVRSIIDFGDVVSTWTVAEPAIACAYAMLGKAHPLEAAAQVVAGYHAAHPLNDPEVTAFFDLLGARLATSVVMSSYQRKLQPGNDYLTVSARPVWALLRQLVWVDAGRAYELFRDACRGVAPVSVPASASAVPGLRPSELLEKRRRVLGPSLSVAYREPLKIVRGFMQYLYDEDGRAYLDGVNNVCHVGHCHPRVVRAAQEQMAVLNTNTRYLHDHLVRYAERLASTFPDPLRVCFFVCSGSEANELALRLARTHAGARDVVVVDGAYHGNTSSLVDLSPYKFDGPGGAGAPEWVKVVPMPDVYRGPYKASDPEAGRRYAGHVAEAIEEVRRDGRGVAAFFCESMLGCGGQVVLPEGYLEAAFRAVREAGGVCVVDEVQTGFGRAGRHFWAFEAQGVVPDVVTLGKPIGNGHPLGAVITTPEIAASFRNGMEYFNTFGGNPVSAAVGLAVLDVLADEGLQENARRVGAKLLHELGGLAEKHVLIGDVRGLGLFVGVELVRDRETLEPATAEAKAVVERMKEEGILLSTDGPLENVIKLKPPLVFSSADADRLVATLDVVLTEVETSVEA